MYDAIQRPETRLSIHEEFSHIFNHIFHPTNSDNGKTKHSGDIGFSSSVLETESPTTNIMCTSTSNRKREVIKTCHHVSGQKRFRTFRRIRQDRINICGTIGSRIIHGRRDMNTKYILARKKGGHGREDG